MKRISIYLDTRRETKTGLNKGKYQIKLVLNYTVMGKRSRHYFPTGEYVTEAEYGQVMGKKVPRDTDLQKIRQEIIKQEGKANDILQDNPGITPEEFGSKFTGSGSFRDPLGLLLSTAEQMRRDGREGNYTSYKQSHASLKKFVDEKCFGSVSFAQITPKWLQNYENWLLQKDISIATVGIYLRPLRAIFNQERGKSIPWDIYPFTKRDYKIPTSKARHLALSEEQKNTILKYQSENPGVQKAVDYWVFSYFCNGMNFADIASLKVKHVNDGFISMQRNKSAYTKRDKKDIVIPMREEVKRIILKHGNRTLDPSSYVFPILEAGLSSITIKGRIRDFIRETNAGLRLACEDMKIPVITTYSARHTFATILLRKGATTEQIQEALGHSDIKTTRNYLDGFDWETKKAISDKL